MNNRLLAGFLLALIIPIGCSVVHADDLNREQRIAESPQWDGNTFRNPEQVPNTEIWPSLKMLWAYYNKPEGYLPGSRIPAEPFDIDRWNEPHDLQFTWLGHTTFLIRIDNKVILTDPIFSARAGSFGWLSPGRYSETLPAADVLPEIDVVLITHNHSDHLDEDSIKALAPGTRHFVTPLAAGQLLEAWGVPDEKIHELDWWQTKSIDGLTITAAPAKHTSERGIFDKNKTLWASYGIHGPKHNLYLSGDSGWFEGLYEIGERLGPFDLTFFEIGAYSNLKGQMEVHYTPEQAVKAHRAVRGKLMVPSGWGTFDLGLFAWYEPVERFLIEANRTGVDYLTPEIGEVVVPGEPGGRKEWWVPFITKSQ